MSSIRSPTWNAIVPSDEPDLTKRPYCAICHAALDPLATFWERWAPVATGNYRYDPSQSAQGTFNGQSGTDISGLANIFTQSEDFRTCSVERAFEYLVGRSMHDDEKTNMLPPLKDKLSNQNFNLWNIMLDIMESESFKGVPRDDGAGGAQ